MKASRTFLLMTLRSPRLAAMASSFSMSARSPVSAITLLPVLERTLVHWHLFDLLDGLAHLGG